jgi:hypothetical protein
MIQEKIEYGHRITRWSFDAYYNGKWNDISGDKQSIGYKRLLKFNEITASQARLRITEGKGCPMIHTFGLFRSSFASLPVVEAVPLPSSPGTCCKYSGNLFTISGNMLLLPRIFAGKKVRIEIVNLHGRSILDRSVHGNMPELSLPCNVLENRVLCVRCRSDGLRITGSVFTGFR